MKSNAKRKQTKNRRSKNLTISISAIDSKSIHIIVYTNEVITRIEVNGYIFYPNSKFSNGYTFIVGTNNIKRSFMKINPNKVKLFKNSILVHEEYFTYFQ